MLSCSDIKPILSFIGTVIVAFIGVYQVRKTWYIDTVAKQRLEWSENLRRVLTALLVAYHANQDISAQKECVKLYLQYSNKYHQKLLTALDNLQSGVQGGDKDVVNAAQELLHINWWMVKEELGVSKRYELKRDKKVTERLKQEAFKRF